MLRPPRWGLPLLLLALVGVPALAHAQGQAQEILRQPVGAYQVAVAASSAQPVVGPLYLWVTLSEASTGQPVTDAQVTIFAQRSPDSSAGQSRATHSPTAPGTYVADITLDQPGTWLLSFEISSSLGEATATVDLEVRETLRSTGVGTLGFGVVLLVLVLGGLYVAWSVRRATRRRRLGAP